MNQWRSFWRLSLADRRLLIRSLILVGGFRLGVWLLPFRTLQTLLNRMPQQHWFAIGITKIGRITWAVAAASRYVPSATCLVQALAARTLLRMEGFPAHLHIGVAKESGQDFQAHAWVESQGSVVTGGAESDRYASLLVLEA